MAAGGAAVPPNFESGILPLNEWLFVKNDFFTLVKNPFPSLTFSETFSETVGLVSGATAAGASGAGGGVSSATGAGTGVGASVTGAGVSSAAGAGSTGASVTGAEAYLEGDSLLLWLFGNSKVFFIFWKRVACSDFEAGMSTAFDSTTVGKIN